MQVELSPENYQLGEFKNSPNKDDVPCKLDQSLDQCIKRIIEREGFIKYEIDKQCVSTNGGNYLGVLYEVDVKGKTKDGEKELNIFVKKIINDCTILSISDVYVTEMFAYKELSKIFAELQDDANVPLEERYKMIEVYEETNAEAIIMENIARKGFKTYHRMDAVSIEFMELAVKNLAKFHGLSFVIREKRPDYFDERIKSLKHPYAFNAAWQDFVSGVKDLVMNNIDREYEEKIEKVFENLIENHTEYCKDDTIKACLCHGDYRANNIMTKFDDGVVQDIIPVDYQLLHYGCPIFDFLYLIATGTDRNLRKLHMTNLKNLYYETLSKFLKYFDIDSEVVYPREQFEKTYIEKLDYGLMMTLVILPFIFTPENDVPDITKEVSDISFQVDDKYKERVCGIIQDYIEWGYI